MLLAAGAVTVGSLALMGVRRVRPGRSRAAFGVVLAACLLAAGCGGAPPSPAPTPAGGIGSCLHLVVPAYFDPDSTRGWQQVAATAPAVRWVIMNPDNGPGSSREARYVRAVARARRSGEHVLGYVLTGYGKRAQARVLADVARYRRWYGVTDVFFDEAPTGGSFLAEYRRYVSAVHARGGTAVLNPGTVPDPRYFAFADAVVTFESRAARYRSASPPPSPPAAVPAGKIWNIVTAVPGSALGAVLRLAAGRRASVVYVTDAGRPDPYDRLPGYWPREVRAATASCPSPAAQHGPDARAAASRLSAAP